MLSVFGNSFDETDLEGLRQVMATHLVGMGEITSKFEKAFSEKIGFPFGIATNSCTNAFWIILKALDLKVADQIIIPNLHFFGIRNILNLFGVEPIFVDVDPKVPNVSLSHFKDKITSLTKAIIFLEYGGYPCDVSEITDYLKSIHRQDILLILDAANSPFTKKNGQYSALGYDIAAYSFDLNKILVTGDGGMILVKDSKLAQQLKSLSYYGINDLHKSGFQKSKEKTVWWEVEISTPSLKLSMNNLTASLGLTQLIGIETNLQKRKELLSYYLSELDFLREKISLPSQNAAIENNVYLFWIRISNMETRNRLAKFLLGKEIYTTVKYQLLDPETMTPNALNFYQTSLCLPFNQNITSENVDYIVASIKEFFNF